jgi:large subunit ribosomal protein L15
MQAHTLKRNTPNKKTPRVGRGGVRGKTSGRGTKGQKARSGRKMRPEMRDLIKKIPKLRGHGKNRARTIRPRASVMPERTRWTNAPY